MRSLRSESKPYCQLPRNDGGEHKPTNEKGGPKAIPMMGRKKPRARGGSTAGQLADYDRALDRLKAGDWAGFGAELDALRPLLEELSRQPAAR